MGNRYTGKWLAVGVVLVIIMLAAYTWWASSNRERLARDDRVSAPEVERAMAPSPDGAGLPLEIREDGLLLQKETRASGKGPRTVNAVLSEFQGLYAPAGSLDYDEAKNLIQTRKTRADTLARELASQGAEGAVLIQDIYPSTERSRDKLFLIDALSRNPAPAAVEVLTALLEEETVFSMREQMVRALAKHQADQSEQALQNIARAEDSTRLRMAAVQGLSRWQGSLSTLENRVRSDPELSVRLESIRSIGIQGSPEARETLQELTFSDSDIQVRQQALTELVRSFPENSLPTLQRVVQAGDEKMRVRAVQDLNRLDNDESIQMLQKIAGNDPSPVVRERAARILENSSRAMQ